MRILQVPSIQIEAIKQYDDLHTYFNKMLQHVDQNNRTYYWDAMSVVFLIVHLEPHKSVQELTELVCLLFSKFPFINIYLDDPVMSGKKSYEMKIKRVAESLFDRNPEKPCVPLIARDVIAELKIRLDANPIHHVKFVGTESDGHVMRFDETNGVIVLSCDGDIASLLPVKKMLETQNTSSTVIIFRPCPCQTHEFFVIDSKQDYEKFDSLFPFVDKSDVKEVINTILIHTIFSSDSGKGLFSYDSRKKFDGTFHIRDAEPELTTPFIVKFIAVLSHCISAYSIPVHLLKKALPAWSHIIEELNKANKILRSSMTLSPSDVKKGLMFVLNNYSVTGTDVINKHVDASLKMITHRDIDINNMFEKFGSKCVGLLFALFSLTTQERNVMRGHIKELVLPRKDESVYSVIDNLIDQMNDFLDPRHPNTLFDSDTPPDFISVLKQLHYCDLTQEIDFVCAPFTLEFYTFLLKIEKIDTRSVCKFSKGCKNPSCPYYHNPKIILCKDGRNCQKLIDGSCVFLHTKSHYQPDRTTSPSNSSPLKETTSSPSSSPPLESTVDTAQISLHASFVKHDNMEQLFVPIEETLIPDGLKQMLTNIASIYGTEPIISFLEKLNRKTPEIHHPFPVYKQLPTPVLQQAHISPHTQLEQKVCNNGRQCMFLPNCRFYHPPEHGNGFL